MVAIFRIEDVEGVASVLVSLIASMVIFVIVSFEEKLVSMMSEFVWIPAEEEKSESSVVFRLVEVSPTTIAMARIPEDKRQKRRTPTSHLCSTAGTSVFVVVDALVFSFIVTMF